MAVKAGSRAPIRLATVAGRYPRLTRYRPKPPTVGPIPSSRRIAQPLHEVPSHRKLENTAPPPKRFMPTLKRNRNITALLNPYSIVVHGSMALFADVLPSML